LYPVPAIWGINCALADIAVAVITDIVTTAIRFPNFIRCLLSRAILLTNRQDKTAT